MTYKIHDKKPCRTCGDNFAQYNKYKPALRNDFNRRCGYCDDDDYSCGGSRGYQIDHFKPVSKGGDETDYGNLVYACPICNRAKWDIWLDVDGFVDPCCDHYDDHLRRRRNGTIRYLTQRGKFIFESLKLGLGRHAILWQIRKLDQQKQKLSSKIDQIQSRGNNKRLLEVLLEFKALSDSIDNYTRTFRESI